MLESKREQKTQKPIILSAYQERVSLRGLKRIFDMARQSISRWIVEQVKGLPKLKDTLLPAEPEVVLEWHEAWSFVLQKINKCWLRMVMCRRTRQIIAFAISDRSEATRRRLWNKVPLDYRSCISCSDFWVAYQKVLPQAKQHAVGKESGQVSHMERWYCTLRQRQARYVRKTLSFSNATLFITWSPNGLLLITILPENISHY